RECGSEPEDRALTCRALKSSLPSHHLHKFAHDRETQTGASILARRGSAGLGEWIEQKLLLVDRHSDSGVHHLEPHGAALVLHPGPHADGHFTALSELHSVAHQVKQYLAQPVLVATEAGGNPGVDEAGEFQAFFL